MIKKYGIARLITSRYYFRLLDSSGYYENDNTPRILKQNNTFISACDLEFAFRMSGMDLRFATAKIAGIIQNIIMIDCKGSGVERYQGRYAVYTYSLKDGYYHIDWLIRYYPRLPDKYNQVRYPDMLFN